MNVKTKNIRHHFGTPNPILNAEEDGMLATVERAVASAPNAQIIGRNGELPLVQFFNRYLPFTFRAASGFFVTPSGKRSPQIDLLILDARYPLLAQNGDGSVLAMLHAVVWAVETKTNLRSSNLVGMWSNARTIMALADEVDKYGLVYEPVSVRTSAFAYGVAQGVEATTRAFIDAAQPDDASLHVSIMRLPRDREDRRRGVELQFESNWPRGSKKKMRWSPVRRFTHTPLSDLYYDIVQWSYLIIEQRDWSGGDVGQQMSDYMTWATDGEPQWLKVD
jgi:hypothetical protein